MSDSPHPITNVAGEPALLAHIVDLMVEDSSSSPSIRDNAFSESTRKVLRRSVVFASTETADGRPVVDCGSYLRAVMAGAREEAERSTAYARPEVNVLRAIVGDDLSRADGLVDAVASAGGEISEPLRFSTVVAAPDLTLALSEAGSMLVSVTPGQNRVDARHALVAILKTIEAQQAIWTAGLSTEATPSDVIGRIGPAIESALQENVAKSEKIQESSDDLNAWRSHISSIEAHSGIQVPEPERRSEARYAKDKPVERLPEDRLGLSTEVRALAEVICLREPGPPLAVGLFGDWGSGKSTYMNLLEAAIDELTEQAQTDKAARDVFVDGVVHIKFNAWHYNDVDLWSSLTSEFFRQLRIGGYAGGGAEAYSRLVSQVASRVAEAEKAADEEGKNLDQKRTEATELRVKIEKLDQDERTLDRDTLVEQAEAVLGELRSADSRTVADFLRLVGYDASGADHAKSVNAIKLEMEKVLAVGGKARTVGQGLWNAVSGRGGSASSRLYGNVAIGAVVATALVAGLHRAFPETFGAGLGAVTSVFSLIGVLYAAAVPVLKVLDPVFRAANAAALTLEVRQQEIASERKEKVKALGRLEDEIGAIEAKRKILLADAERFRPAGPEQIYDFFLRESETTRAFDKSLGVVSHVRRAFETLDAIFAEARRNKKDRPEHARFDRIVLYIDDLDRCRAQQVVEVLEAVHLLLAFRLFVVVVGVDARWLEQSLLEFYKDKLGDTNGDAAPRPPDSGAVRNRSTRGQATVHDFLEKIFQIPVRLRRLSALPRDRFASYVRETAGPVSYPGEPGGGRIDGTREGGRTEIKPLAVEIRPIEPAAGAAPEQVRLTRPEVELIESLGPIAGKTPRAVKRFVNLYRLMRGMRRGAALDDFLGAIAAREGDSVAKPFAAYQLWLAVDVGLPLLQARSLRRAVAKLDPMSIAATTLLEPVEMPGPGVPNAVPILRQASPPAPMPNWWSDLNDFWRATEASRLGDMHAAITAAMNSLPGQEGTRVLKTALLETRRFSADRRR